MGPPREVAAFCDFNGTIVDRDMLDYLASTTDKRTESAPLPNERGHRADIARRAKALTLDRADAERRIEDGIHFDESFVPFIAACEEVGIELVVLTSGIQSLVERYLLRRGIRLPIIGNEANMNRSGWVVKFRDESVAGIDKRRYVERAIEAGKKTIVIGDDRSDFEAALVASSIFAKAGSELKRFLDVRDLPYHPFSSFAEILERWPPKTW
ncbi:MAG: HAD-IB family phosphatase [bacterium]|nr:HAD-IB family phosphatase [bacterium]